MKYDIFCLDKLTDISNSRGNIIQLSEERKLLKCPLQSLFRIQVYITMQMEKTIKIKILEKMNVFAENIYFFSSPIF